MHEAKKFNHFDTKNLGQILVPLIYFQILVKFRLLSTQRVTGSLVLYIKYVNKSELF